MLTYADVWFIAALPTTIGNMTALRELAITGNRLLRLLQGPIKALSRLYEDSLLRLY
jgi:hypothetical protein